MNCDSWISLFTGISTFLAVVVALFGNDIRALWHEPKLNIAVKDTAERNQAGGIEETWYYHLEITNLRKAIAYNTVVVLTRIEEPWHGEMRPIWHGETPLSWMYGIEFGSLYKTIGPKQYCDVIAIGEKSGAYLKTFNRPYNMAGPWKSAINIIITVQVKSDQYTTTESKFSINWDGKWEYDEKEMAQHLSIKALP